jgi:hypothetical protein
METIIAMNNKRNMEQNNSEISKLITAFDEKKRSYCFPSFSSYPHLTPHMTCTLAILSPSLPPLQQTKLHRISTKSRVYDTVSFPKLQSYLPDHGFVRHVFEPNSTWYWECIFPHVIRIRTNKKKQSVTCLVKLVCRLRDLGPDIDGEYVELIHEDEHMGINLVVKRECIANSTYDTASTEIHINVPLPITHETFMKQINDFYNEV